MTDIVELLRTNEGCPCDCHEAYKGRGLVDQNCHFCATEELRTEAADEIERLRTETGELRRTVADLTAKVSPPF